MKGILALKKGILELSIFLALLGLVSAQASTPEELLGELEAIPGINITQVNVTTYMVMGAVQASEAGAILNQLGELPGINVTQVNDTAYAFVMKPAGNLSAAPCCGSLTTDTCGVRTNGKCDPDNVRHVFKNCPDGCNHVCGHLYGPTACKIVNGQNKCCGKNRICCTGGTSNAYDDAAQCDYAYCT